MKPPGDEPIERGEVQRQRRQEGQPQDRAERGLCFDDAFAKFSLRAAPGDFAQTEDDQEPGSGKDGAVLPIQL